MLFYLKYFLTLINMVQYKEKIKLKYTLVDSKKTEINIVEKKQIFPEIGGIKLIYEVAVLRPGSWLFGLIKCNRVEHKSTIVFYKPLKEIYGPEDSVSKHQRTKSDNPYYKIWLQLEKDFADIRKEQYTIKPVYPKNSSDITKTVGDNNKLVSHLDKEDEIFYIIN